MARKVWSCVVTGNNVVTLPESADIILRTFSVQPTVSGNGAILTTDATLTNSNFEGSANGTQFRDVISHLDANAANQTVIMYNLDFLVPKGTNVMVSTTGAARFQVFYDTIEDSLS